MAGQVQPVDPAAGEEEPEVDYKAKYEEMRAHMREQERRAKENAAAARELEQLKAERMTETERLQKQLDDARTEADALRTEKERREWVAEASSATGVPSALLEMIGAESADDLMEKAESIKSELGLDVKQQAAAVPVVLGDGRHAEIGEARSANDWLRSTIRPNN